jgi:uncharacterized membrane protein YkoI
MSRRVVLAGVAIGALAVAGAGVATAIGSGDEAERSATGAGAERAKAAALEITRGGTANAVERDSENGARWEVEVTKPDGETVDVRLDAAYRKVIVERDSEAAGDSR